MSALSLKLSLRLTDCSHISRGDVSILHALNLCRTYGIIVPDGRALQSITSKGLMKLSDVGTWYKNPNGTLTFSPHSQPASGLKWTAIVKENWKEVAGILKLMKCEWLYEGDGTLLLTRMIRRDNAELYIHAMLLIVPLQSSCLPHNG